MQRYGIISYFASITQVVFDYELLSKICIFDIGNNSICVFFRWKKKSL